MTSASSLTVFCPYNFCHNIRKQSFLWVEKPLIEKLKQPTENYCQDYCDKEEEQDTEEGLIFRGTCDAGDRYEPRGAEGVKEIAVRLEVVEGLHDKGKEDDQGAFKEVQDERKALEKELVFVVLH